MKKMSDPTCDAATADVAAVLSGLAILAFLESYSAAAKEQQQQQQQQQQQPATSSLVKREHPRTNSHSVRKLKLVRPTVLSKTFIHPPEIPRHVFALPSSSLPSQPGLFDGSEIAARLLALQARQSRPNCVGRK